MSFVVTAATFLCSWRHRLLCDLVANVITPSWWLDTPLGLSELEDIFVSLPTVYQEACQPNSVEVLLSLMPLFLCILSLSVYKKEKG